MRYYAWTATQDDGDEEFYIDSKLYTTFGKALDAALENARKEVAEFNADTPDDEKVEEPSVNAMGKINALGCTYDVTEFEVQS